MKNLITLIIIAVTTVSYGQCVGTEPVPQIEVLQDCQDTWQNPGVDVGSITITNFADYSSISITDLGNNPVSSVNMSAGSYIVSCTIGTCTQIDTIIIDEGDEMHENDGGDTTEDDDNDLCSGVDH